MAENREGKFGDVLLTADASASYDFKGKTTVVIDVLRASGTIIAACDAGYTVIPVAETEEALSLRSPEVLLAGERDGKKIDGFDTGNSPLYFRNHPRKHDTLIITTTNGTRLLKNCEDSDQVLIGSFINIDAVVDFLSLSGNPVVLACAGWKGQFSLEDTLLAGAVAQRLKLKHTSDSWKAAQNLFESVSGVYDNFIRENASHCKRLQEPDAQKDIAFCLQMNVTRCLPVVKKGKIVA
jgi:2-phosphosulfolactate phosphatase